VAASLVVGGECWVGVVSGERLSGER
jgi:hypothetical protein